MMEGILDELLKEFVKKDTIVDIVCDGFSVDRLLTADECKIIKNQTTASGQFVTMFDLLNLKDEKLVFRKLQEICLKQKWRDLLKTVQLKLKSVEKDSLILTTVEQQEIHRPFIHGVPSLTTKIFVGRKKQLAELHQLLNQSCSNSESLANSVNVVVCGLGGVGKTQLALKYIKDNCLDFDAIVWINSESLQSMRDSFKTLAETETLKISDISIKDIKTIVTEIYRKLSETASKTLIVFDNVDIFIPVEFLPNFLYRFFVLITSRYQNWDQKKILNLKVFEDKEAIDFINKSLSSENYDSDKEVKCLANELRNFPLALQQAVAYIQQSHKRKSFLTNRFTINDYMKEYAKCRRKLLDYKSCDGYNNSNIATTLNTWTVTVEKLKTLDYDRDTFSVKRDSISGDIMNETLQIKILHLISYMASEKIDPDLFLEVANKDKEHLEWAVCTLGEYSMVHTTIAARNKSNAKCTFLNVHKLVQEVTRLHLEDDKQEEQTFQIVFHVLDNNFPTHKDMMDDIAKKRELLLHLVALKVEIEKYGKKNQLEERMQRDYLYNILVKLHDGYYNNGNPAQEKDSLLQLLLIQHRFLGYNNCEVAKTLTNLGNAVGALGHIKTKKILLERALEIKELHYGHDHFEVAIILTSLAVAHGQLGEPKTKKTLLDRALKIDELHYGPNHFENAITLANLANAHGALGDPKTQKMLLERALKIKELHYGPDHFEVAITLTNLAVAHGALGDPKTTKMLMERALKIQELHYGPDHYKVAKTLAGLAYVHGALGNPKTKKMLLERALKIDKLHYGPHHFEVARILTNLANAHGDLGDPKSKKMLLERALKIQELHYGPDHFEVARTLKNLANAHGQMGDPKTQKMLLERALKIDELHYGPDHLEVVKILTNLANAHGQLGDSKTKKMLLERASNINEKHYGVDHLQSVAASVMLTLSNGDLSESCLELLENFLSIANNRFQPDHPLILAVMETLAAGYAKTGNTIREAEILFKFHLLQYPKLN